jgi:hypothetical protein
MIAENTALSGGGYRAEITRARVLLFRNPTGNNCDRVSGRGSAMAYYVILNFEDRDPNFGGVGPNRIRIENPGNKMKRSQALIDSGAAGDAARATTHVYANRVGFSGEDREIVFYPCQEILAAEKNNTLSRTSLDAVRKDCEASKTIAVFIHGILADTEHGFATGGVEICTWQDLGRLMLLVLPKRQREYNIALLMCYGARSSNAKLNHEGMIPPEELRTSFAYKFFRSICQLHNIRMSARTGLVKTDQGVHHLVESEEWVMSTIMYQHGLQAQKGLKKAEMDTRVMELCKEHRIPREHFDTIVEEFAKNPAQIAWGPVQLVAKQYVIYSPHMSTYVKNSFKDQRLAWLEKYGKLIYTYKNGTLEIISRFDPDRTGKTYTLYQGALLD